MHPDKVAGSARLQYKCHGGRRGTDQRVWRTEVSSEAKPSYHLPSTLIRPSCCAHLQQGVDADRRDVVVLVGDADDDDGVRGRARRRDSAAAVPRADQQPVDGRRLAVDAAHHRHVAGQPIHVEHLTAGTGQRRRAHVVLHLAHNHTGSHHSRDYRLLTLQRSHAFPPRRVFGLDTLSLLSSAGREMSTSQSAVMLCGWGVKAGMAHST